MSGIAELYFDAVIAHLTGLKVSLKAPMEQAKAAILEAARADRRVFVFGTGHSHMLAEELHYRAGGLAITVPVLVTSAMLHESAVASSAFERRPGVIPPILQNYGLGAGDVLVVASNSGVNAAPVEAADFGRDVGATVIAVTSVEYSKAVAQGRRRLADVAHIVLDNGLPPGDAVIALADSGFKIGPLSTAIGATILNAIIAEVSSELAKSGEPPLYRSANMPGASEINEALVRRYRDRNPHL